MACNDDLKKDGYLNVDVAARNIVYHPHLNVILIFTKCGSVKVYKLMKLCF